jgi:serine/threonine-protein kinase
MVQTLIKRCLRKDPARRLHDIADARIEIEEALAEPADARRATGAGVTAAVIESPAWRQAIPWVAAGLVVGAALGAVGLWYSLAPTALEVTRTELSIEEDLWLSGGNPVENNPGSIQRPTRTAMTLSPDGRQLVYNATDGERSQLYLRPLDQDHATAISGTEGARGPFFSPDGQWVGFFARDETGLHLKRVDLERQVPQTIIADVQTERGASWGDDDTIVFQGRLIAGEPSGLFRVPVEGGTPERLTTGGGDPSVYARRWPHVLPGSKAVLLTVLKGEGRWEEAEIVVVSLETDDVTTLITDGADPRYTASGHLVFARRGTLMAVRFDPERLETSGEPAPVIEDLMQAIGAGTSGARMGSAQFAVSESGTLVYALGGIHPEPQHLLVHVDQNGVAEPFNVDPGGYIYPRLSPDGTQIAYTRSHGASGNIWIYDIPSRLSTQLTFGTGFDKTPTWSPDGEWIAFASDRGDPATKVWRIAAGGGEPARLTSSSGNHQVSSWSQDDVLVFWSDWDIWTLPLEGDPPVPTGDPQRLGESNLRLLHPVFSNDGRWVAYLSSEVGQNVLWVRPYPGPGTPTPVTTGGGVRLGAPTWSQKQSQIFYRTGSKMMVVDVTPGERVSGGVARELFDVQYVLSAPVRSYDVDKDGEFVMVTRVEVRPQPVTRIQVVSNWLEELKERLPTHR